MSKPNHSAVGRGLKIGKLGLSLTGSYLGYQLQNLFRSAEAREAGRRRFRQNSSRRVRVELESLKGPIMKLGQILSLQTHVLPKEMIDELARLQMRAPGMHPTLSRAQFKGSLGKYPEEVFREFDPDPFAAASLGQVHRALTRDGQRVAVKIQYPAIRAAIENDFKLLNSSLLPGRLAGYAPAALLEEIRRGFLEETDYLNEGRNADFFRHALRQFSFLSIPEIRWDLTTERVLTMSLLEGASPAEFLQRRPSQAVRDTIGARLFELYHHQVQKLQALHADQHPGNYLFQEDGRIGLVDFGCVKRFSLDLAGVGRACIQRAWSQSDAKASQVLKVVFGPNTTLKQGRAMLTHLENMADILFPRTGDARVDFGKPAVLNLLGHALGKAVRHKLANPEFAFISRAELGLYALLHQLGARVNATEICRRVGGW
jgi:predicted unusual protein kinase regulating ubiquinone biosynthesis (AarF/ABC1/UbiB family)